MIVPSLTNVTFPENLSPGLREAVEHYGFENLNQFFRVCGYAIIQHHQRGDILATPYAFLSVPELQNHPLCKK